MTSTNLARMAIHRSMQQPQHTTIDIMPEVQPQQVVSVSSQNSSGCSRLFRRLHPAQFCSASGICIGVAAAVVSAVAAYFTWESESYVGFTGSVISGSLGLAMATISCISTGYLCAWKPQKKLEEAIVNVNNAAQQVDRQQTTFQVHLQGLEQEVEKLQNQLLQEQHLYQTAKIGLQEKTLEIEKLTEKLSAIKTGLEKAQQLAKTWQTSASTITQEVGRFQMYDLESNSHDISLHVESLSSTNTQLNSDIDELSSLSIELQSLRSSWVDMTRKIQETFTLITKDARTKTNSLEEAKMEIDRLQKSEKDLQLANSKMEETLQQLKNLNDRYERSVSILSKATESLQQNDTNDL